MNINTKALWQGTIQSQDPVQLEQMLQRHPLYPLDESLSGLSEQDWSNTVIKLYQVGFDTFAMGEGKRWLEVLMEHVPNRLRVSEHWEQAWIDSGVDENGAQWDQWTDNMYQLAGVFTEVHACLLDTNDTQLIDFYIQKHPDVLHRAQQDIRFPLDASNSWTDWIRQCQEGGYIPYEESQRGLLYLAVSLRASWPVIQHIGKYGVMDHVGDEYCVLELAASLDEVNTFEYILSQCDNPLEHCFDLDYQNGFVKGLAQQAMLNGSFKVFERLIQSVENYEPQSMRKRYWEQTINNKDVQFFVHKEMSSAVDARTIGYDKISALCIAHPQSDFTLRVKSQSDVDNFKLLKQLVVSHREGYKTLPSALKVAPTLLDAPCALHGLTMALCTKAMVECGAAEVLIGAASKRQLRQWVQMYPQYKSALMSKKQWSGQLVDNAQEIQARVQNKLELIGQLFELEKVVPKKTPKDPKMVRRV